MKIYLLVEDGESFCIRANNMSEAINFCEQSYLEEIEEERGMNYQIEIEKEYYREQILQSCSLVGLLKN